MLGCHIGVTDIDALGCGTGSALARNWNVARRARQEIWMLAMETKRSLSKRLNSSRIDSTMMRKYIVVVCGVCVLKNGGGQEELAYIDVWCSICVSCLT
jgi:hypothetical protein